ncbi:hypothetical protein [Actinoplanes sp. G11-F43]|uniref:hypothetical protein n=1 Tax=Actinoplanes sp. G11-F43 TaxID=3424130 RepID=UPI003D3425C2
MEQYRTARRVLIDELGLEPGELLRQMEGTADPDRRGVPGGPVRRRRPVLGSGDQHVHHLRGADLPHRLARHPRGGAGRHPAGR